MITKLGRIAQNADNPLRQAVAREVIDHANSDEDVKHFLLDVLQHGCISGVVPSLIYYVDTHSFYDKHYNAIEALREEYEETIGKPLQVSGDLKNYLAWFAFEETAYRIAGKLDVI